MAETKRLTVGRRVQVYGKTEDFWFGCFVASDAVYICPLPMIVIRWRRGRG